MNKVVGVLDILIGSLILIFISLMNLLVIPKIASLYQQSNMDISGSLLASYISCALMLILGLLNLYIGFKSFKSKNHKYFKWAIGMLVINFLLGGLLFFASIFSTTLAIHTLTTSF